MIFLCYVCGRINIWDFMDGFWDEVLRFLEDAGIGYRTDGAGGGRPSILCRHLRSGDMVRVVPADILATNREEALEQQRDLAAAVTLFSICDGVYPLIISRDRWERRKNMMQERILAHLGSYIQIYARNCEVRRIDKPLAAAFLANTHSYGDAACRYRYGLFLSRHTGHCRGEEAAETVAPGTLVAVAEFSGARRWDKGGKIISSYEWTRYACLPNLRISGAMGKILDYFISQVHPDDIMSYADLEWSEGAVYEKLGFVPEGMKEPVEFVVNPSTWERRADSGNPNNGYLRFINLGSRKYRLKLTEYQI